MKEYRLYAVVPALIAFIDELTNWYLRRSRRRFWEENASDKQSGYDTLYQVLLTLSKAIAPFLPFLAESIYRNLSKLQTGAPMSVHLCDFPTAQSSSIDKKLEEEMALIVQVVGLGRSLRARDKIKTRQPLRSITVITKRESDAATLRRHTQHIQEELNVKEVLFSAHEEEFVDLSVKPNFPVLGPVFGAQMKEATKLIQGLSRDAVAILESGSPVTVLEKSVDLTMVNVIRTARAGLSIETARGVTVFFDTVIDDGLLAEGVAREFVNRVQKMRKDAGLQVADRISLAVTAPPELAGHLEAQHAYITTETLTTSLDMSGNAAPGTPGPLLVQDHEIDEWKFSMSLGKVG
jgi:isoleucyl-tRNA synthetase